MTPQVLVLAAGKSTRIAEAADGLPKPLLKVGEDCILGWNLRWLAAYGVRDVWINLHYRADDIRSAIGAGARYGLGVRYSEEPEILGTAGAWRQVADGKPGPWLVVYGDNLTRLDLAALLAKYRPMSAVVALFDAGRHTNTGIFGGRAVLEGDRISGFAEGAPGDEGGLVNTGVYVIDGALSAEIPDGFADFGCDVFPAMAARGALRAHVLEPAAFCLGLDTPEHFELGRRIVSAGMVTL